MKKQNGFTLIELIIVIIILGILAIFAVPKFMSISKETNVSTVKALGGSIHEAADMVHGLAIANNATPGGSVNTGTTNVDLATGSRYPAATDAGINKALANADGFTFNAGLYTKDGSATPANCSVNYTVTGDAYTVVVTDTGC